jgi:ribosome recycling factor
MPIGDAQEFFGDAQDEARQWLQGELATLRSGRVTPGMVHHVPVEYYGSRTELVGLASISNADARTLVISAWDAGAVTAIAKALTSAELGALPNVDGNIIRLVFPSLTEEVRDETVKQLYRRAEEARVRLRQARDEALKSLKEEKEAGKITEDDFFDGKKKLDELIDAGNREFDEIAKKKEAEVRTI